METGDLPEVRAFQDDFTRSFLHSTEETRPGYYPFLSGTEAFKLDFPAEGKLGEKSYNIREKNYEAIMIGVGSPESEIRSEERRVGKEWRSGRARDPGRQGGQEGDRR